MLGSRFSFSRWVFSSCFERVPKWCWTLPGHRSWSVWCDLCCCPCPWMWCTCLFALVYLWLFAWWYTMSVRFRFRHLPSRLLWTIFVSIRFSFVALFGVVWWNLAVSGWILYPMVSLTSSLCRRRSPFLVTVDSILVVCASLLRALVMWLSWMWFVLTSLLVSVLVKWFASVVLLPLRWCLKSHLRPKNWRCVDFHLQSRGVGFHWVWWKQVFLL